jgi:hypothetical protein
MRNKIVIGLVVAAVLGFVPPAVPATVDVEPCAKQAGAVSMPLPQLRLAACRHVQCNCRHECIRWNNQGNCIQTYRTCDVCSICD